MTTLAQHVGRVSANIEHATRSREFISYCRYLMLAAMDNGGPALALQFAERGRASPTVCAILKSAVSAATTTDPNWASALAEHRQLSTAFLGSLRPFNALDKILPDLFPAPLRTQITVETSSASAALVGELEGKPAGRFEFANRQLDPAKVVGWARVNNEVIRFAPPGTLDVLGRLLFRAVAKKSDETFLNILTQTTGVASVAATGDFGVDMKAALDEIEYEADAKLYLVLSPAASKVLTFATDVAPAPPNVSGRLFPAMTVTGGNIGGINVVVSSAATDEAVLFDASQIAGANETIVVRASSEASIQGSDTPGSGAQNLISLWQTNQVAVIAERYLGIEVLVPESVCIISGVTA